MRSGDSFYRSLSLFLCESGALTKAKSIFLMVDGFFIIPN